MKQKIVLEINGVRHRLIKTRAENPCTKCSVNGTYCINHDIICGIDPAGTHFRKCKPGE